MGKKSPSVPTPPDPVATAQAQGQANREALDESARINAVNLYGPNGSVTYARGADGIPTDQYTQLTPQSQWLYDAQQAIAGQLSQQAYNRVGQIPTDSYSLQGMPYSPSSYNTAGYSTFSPISYPRNIGQADTTFPQPNTTGYDSFFRPQQPQQPSPQNIASAISSAVGSAGKGSPQQPPQGSNSGIVSGASGQPPQYQQSPGTSGGQTVPIDNHWFPDSSVYTTPGGPPTNQASQPRMPGTPGYQPTPSAPPPPATPPPAAAPAPWKYGDALTADMMTRAPASTGTGKQKPGSSITGYGLSLAQTLNDRYKGNLQQMLSDRSNAWMAPYNVKSAQDLLYLNKQPDPREVTGWGADLPAIAAINAGIRSTQPNYDQLLTNYRLDHPATAAPAAAPAPAPAPVAAAPRAAAPTMPSIAPAAVAPKALAPAPVAAPMAALAAPKTIAPAPVAAPVAAPKAVAPLPVAPPVASPLLTPKAATPVPAPVAAPAPVSLPKGVAPAPAVAPAAPVPAPVAAPAVAPRPMTPAPTPSPVAAPVAPSPAAVSTPSPQPYSYAGQSVPQSSTSPRPLTGANGLRPGQMPLNHGANSGASQAMQPYGGKGAGSQLPAPTQVSGGNVSPLPQTNGQPGQPGANGSIPASYPTANLNALPYDPRSYGNINMYDQNVQNAVFDQQMKNLKPVIDQNFERQYQALQDRGIPVGSDAWNKAVDTLNRDAGNQYQQAANQAIAAAGQEAQRQMSMEQGLRNTAWTEALGAHQQDNSDIQQRLQIEQNLRNQAIQEYNMQRTGAFNEASAFLQGSPALQMQQTPNMPTYTMQAPDVIGATMSAYNGQMQAYNAQVASAGSAWQGAAGIVGGLASKCSRTYKHDDAPATRVLDALKQIPVRTWRYKPNLDPRQELHIGPYAEDWKNFLGLGTGMEINHMDAIGVLMKSVQELSDELTEMKVASAKRAKPKKAAAKKVKAKKGKKK